MPLIPGSNPCLPQLTCCRPHGASAPASTPTWSPPPPSAASSRPLPTAGPPAQSPRRWILVSEHPCRVSERPSHAPPAARLPASSAAGGGRTPQAALSSSHPLHYKGLCVSIPKLFEYRPDDQPASSRVCSAACFSYLVIAGPNPTPSDLLCLLKETMPMESCHGMHPARSEHVLPAGKNKLFAVHAAGREPVTPNATGLPLAVAWPFARCTSPLAVGFRGSAAAVSLAAFVSCG